MEAGLKRAADVGGLVVVIALVEVGGAAAANPPATSTPDRSAWAQVIAGVIIGVVTVAAGWLGKRPVALTGLTLSEAGGQKTIAAGQSLTDDDLKSEVVIDPNNPGTTRALVKGQDYSEQRGPFLRFLIVGADNRWSTSKFQALLWTYALVYAILALMFAKWLDNPSGFSALTKMTSSDWDVYLILLGGPFASLVLAKYITETKTAELAIDKTTATSSSLSPTKGLGELFANDAGQADLGATQYLIFNIVVLAYFIGTFAANLSDGLPTLPSILVGLTSVSAATYVTSKAATKAPPSVTSILPTTVHAAQAGQIIRVFGTNLLSDPPSTPPPSDWQPILVLLDGAILPGVASDGSVGNADRLKVPLPDTLVANSTPVVAVYTANGALAGQQQLSVV